MAKQFVIPTIFSAVDKYSKVVDGMAKKTGSFADKAAIAGARAERALNKFGKAAVNVGLAAGAVGAAIVAALTLPLKEAIKFEDKMADVAKVMNLDAGSAGLKKANDEVKNLAKHLAQAPEAAADLYANIAQSGVLAKDVSEVSRLAGEMGVAFGIEPGIAGEGFVKLQNAMGTTIADAKKVTDALNHLGNNTAAKSAELLEFMATGGAGAARNLKLAGQEAAAFGSVLIAQGKSASEAGTIFERMMKGIFNNDSKRKMFLSAGGGLEGVMAILEKGSKLDGAKQFEFFKTFGQYGTDISMLSKNFGQLKDTLGLVADEANFADSSYLEFLNRQRTTTVRLQKLKTGLTVLAIDLGNILLPLFNKIITKVMPVISSISDWVEQNKELLSTILPVVATSGGLLIAFGAFAGVVGTVAKGIAALNLVQKALNITMSASPIGAILTIIGLLIVAIKWASENTEGWGKQWNATVKWMGAVIDYFSLSVQTIWYRLSGEFMSMVDGIVKGWKWGMNMIGKLSDEQYAADIARMDEAQRKRKELYDMARKGAADAYHEMMVGPGWHVTMKKEPIAQAPIIDGAGNRPEPILPAINPRMMMDMDSRKKTDRKDKVEVIIKDETGNARIGKNPGKIPIVLTPTLGGPKIYGR